MWSVMQWWVIPIASSDNPRGSFMIISGNALQIRAKYGSVAQGPFPTRDAAEAKAHNEPGIPGNPGAAIAKGVQSLNPLNVFHGLDLGNVLLRVGEVLLGIVLLGVGVAKLTGTTNFVSSVVKAKIP
jgi:hypothetical protein